MKPRGLTPALLMFTLLVIAFLLLTGSALAAVEELTLEELVSRASVIIRGRVIDTHARWNADHTRIYTYVTIGPTEYIKGTTQATDLIIRLPGGTVDDVTLQVSDVPTFDAGEETVVFLRDRYFQVVGWYQGKFTIEDGLVVERDEPVEAFISQINQTMSALEARSEQRGDTRPAVMTLDPDLVPTRFEDQEEKPNSSGAAITTPAGWELVKDEGFQGPFPNEWALYGDPTWDDDYYRPHTGDMSGWCANGGSNAVWPPAHYPNNVEAWMVYGPFSLADADDADMYFYHWTKTELNYDYFFAGASTNGTNFSGTRWSGDWSGWNFVDFDLSAYLGEPEVWIGFYFHSDVSVTDEGTFLDDIAIYRHISETQPPDIDSIVPNSGPAHAAELVAELASCDCAADSTSITINGSNFGASQGSSYVRFWREGSTYFNACIDSWSDTQIQARVPGCVSSGDVHVITSAGISNGIYFTVTYSYGGGKWPSGSYPQPMSELYEVNPNCGDTTGELAAIQAAADTWSNVTNSDFYFRYGGTTSATGYGFNDYNEIMWVADTGGSIATNYTWWYISDPHEIVEFDIEFDDGHYTWGTDGGAGKMDVQNIATHELGHSLQLLDLYGTADTEKTMYGFASGGESKKRSLRADDIAGIRYIYPGTGCGDAYEPDDTSGQANWIDDGSTQTHSICPVGDEDWVNFELGAESHVVLETSGPTGDTRMWLYNSALDLVEYDDDDGSGLFAYIDRVCGVDPLPAGAYYVRIDEYGDDNEIASYDLTLTVIPTCHRIFLPLVMKQY